MKTIFMLSIAEMARIRCGEILQSSQEDILVTGEVTHIGRPRKTDIEARVEEPTRTPPKLVTDQRKQLTALKKMQMPKPDSNGDYKCPHPKCTRKFNGVPQLRGHMGWHRKGIA